MTPPPLTIGAGQMFTAYVLVTVTTIVLNAWAAGADFVRAGFVIDTADRLGVPRSWLPLLGVAKAAAAAGLLLGLLGVPLLGVAAAVGLVLLMTGAVIGHLRVRLYARALVPATFLALAAGSAILAVLH